MSAMTGDRNELTTRSEVDESDGVAVRRRGRRRSRERLDLDVQIDQAPALRAARDRDDFARGHRSLLRRRLRRADADGRRARLPHRPGAAEARREPLQGRNRRAGQELAADGQPGADQRGADVHRDQRAGFRSGRGRGARRWADGVRVRHRSAARVRPAASGRASSSSGRCAIHRRRRRRAARADARPLRPARAVRRRGRGRATTSR